MTVRVSAMRHGRLSRQASTADSTVTVIPVSSIATAVSCALLRRVRGARDCRAYRVVGYYSFGFAQVDEEGKSGLIDRDGRWSSRRNTETSRRRKDKHGCNVGHGWSCYRPPT